MTRYFDGMGNEVTSYVERLISENEAYKLENLKLKHAQGVKQEPEKAKRK